MPAYNWVSWALDLNGGIICAPLYYLDSVRPLPEDMPMISSIWQQLQKIYEYAERLARRMHLPRYFLKRHFCHFCELMQPGFFESRVRRFPHLTLDVYRRRVIAAICMGVRRFLEWLRSALLAFPPLTAADPFAPIVIAPARRQLVSVCDRVKGLVVLQPPSGCGVHAFEISPRRTKVWEILRALVGDNTQAGDVKLPDNYATHFRNTNSQNDGVKDDLALLLRHIHPSAILPGHYHLAWETKAELTRK